MERITDKIKEDSKVAWWLVSILGSLLIAGFTFWLSSVNAKVVEIERSEIENRSEIAVLKTTSASTDRRLESIEKKIDKIIDKLP